MPFTFKALKLPFLRISSSPTAGRSFVWHAGPWQYNARTGRHTLKLPGKVKYVSHTRTERAARAKKRAARRATERAGWEKYFAGPPGTPAPVKPAKPGTGRAKQAKKVPSQQTRRSTVATSKARPADETTPAADTGRLSLTQRQEKARAAGLCGARTRDGSPCLNTGQCPHHAQQTR